jgi:hypothetical protein
MGDERLHPMVPFLVELENPFDPDRTYPFPPEELIRFALTASDYWADKALDWLTFGCPVVPVEDDLDLLVVDRSRPQALRHRAKRILKQRS